MPNRNEHQILKIAFLTSCLEPGRDGVGDYTAALADECERLGHQTARLALCDPFATTSRDPRLLRVGGVVNNPDQVALARGFLRDFAPDFVSLQFVCYGFHPRGLCWGAADLLRRIIGRVPVQVMFHELWIGAEKGASWKDRVVGAMQRACMMRLFSRLDIRHTSTSNPAYAALLGRYGMDAEVLPLFGSVPPPQRRVRKERGVSWRFLMFGTLHPVWPPEPLLAHLRALGVPVEIWHAGHVGSGADLWERMAREYAGAISFRKLGPQTPEQLAEFFADVDFGIATTPWEIIGKSASVAAMLEHGLPVIVNRDDVHCSGWREEGYDAQLIKMDERLPERLLAARRRPFASCRAQTASRLLESLQKGLR
jgi:glycosyltransferase involved in cell wall biosynthesis